MKIEVVINKINSQKERGDLLEKIAQQLLESQNYTVIKQIRKTGMEIDLLSKNKANDSKEIYVECKAYNEENKIESAIILKLMGVRLHKNYSEGWLITTSELTKDAKGLLDEIEKGENSKLFTFYTPDKLIEAFISSKLVKHYDVVRKTISNIVKDDNILDEITLIISEYGYFWAMKCIKSGKPVGIILTHANNADIVLDEELLRSISETDTSFKDLDFSIIFNFLEQKNTDYSKISLENMNLDKKYIDQINDVGIKLVHPSKDILVLDDIFVYPNLQHIEGEDKTPLNSKELLDLNNVNKKYLIFGEDISGKTSLAFTIQKEIIKKGFMPLYINAEEINSSDFGKFSKLLVDKFKKQYNSEHQYYTLFEKTILENRKNIVIIIDDLDLLAIKRSVSRSDFFKMLYDNFDNVFIFANASMEIEVMADSKVKETFSTSKILKIKELGHFLRDELLEKWITVEQKEIISDSDLFSRKDEMINKIKVAIGINFLPTYPLYLLTIIQAIEIGSKNKLQGSSYAELYRYLINEALLSVNIKPDDLEFYHAYLSFIAHSFFVKRKKILNTEEIVGICKEYSETMDVERNFDHVHDVLVDAKIFKNENGIYSFSHSYSYYFFTAKYLSDNIEDVKIKEEIEDISRKLYRTEFANIIIFLVHHSKNRSIIDNIIKESNKLFNGVIPSTLSGDELMIVNNLIQEEIKTSIQDKSPDEHRKERLKMRDESENTRKEKNNINNKIEEEDELEDLSFFAKINLAFKLMEILGQITNNHYSLLDGDRKVGILEEVHSLGFRSLHSLLDDFNNYLDVIKKEVREYLEKKSFSSDYDKEKLVNKIIFTFNELIITVFIKKISDSIASKNLFTSSNRIANKNNTPAAKLVDIAVRLNFSNQLDIDRIMALDMEFKDNQIAKRLLRFLVVEHIYKFPVLYSLKQSICDRLGIAINKNKSALISKK